jgi:hypothetical protein
MPQPPEPVGRRPVRDRQIPSKFERIFSYCVISVVILLGFLVLVGAFGISPQFKGIIGVILIGYGLVRLLMMKGRSDRLGQRRDRGMEEEDKEGGDILRK